MSKKHFIAIADAIREHNRIAVNGNDDPFTDSQLDMLARTFKGMNSNFMRERWIGYIKGENGPSGGPVKR